MVIADWKAKNKEFLELVLPLDIVARKLLIPLLFLIAVVSYFYSIPYPLLPLAVILGVYFLISEVAFWLIKREYFPAAPVYFLLLCADDFLVAAAAYYSGGAESFAPIIYIVIGVFAGLTLPLWGIFGIILTGGMCYFGELAIEAFGLLPHVNIFKEFIPPEAYLSSAYMRIIPLAYFTVSIAIALTAFTVAELLEKRNKHLYGLNLDLDKSSKLLVRRDLEVNDINRQLDEKIHELEALKAGLEAKVKERTRELEEAKAGLEIKVTERTAELEKERASLEEKVKDRTRELESAKAGLEEKVAELEEFHDLTVGRELKMIELEKEIESLKHPADKNE